MRLRRTVALLKGKEGTVEEAFLETSVNVDDGALGEHRLHALEDEGAIDLRLVLEIGTETLETRRGERVAKRQEKCMEEHVNDS